MNHLRAFEPGTPDAQSQSPAILWVAGARRFRALPSSSAERTTLRPIGPPVRKSESPKVRKSESPLTAPTPARQRCRNPRLESPARGPIDLAALHPRPGHP